MAVTKTIGAAGDYTTINDWATYIAGLSTPWADDQVGVLIDATTYTLTSTILDINTDRGGHTLTLKADPSVKHDGTIGSGAEIRGGSARMIEGCRSIIFEDISFYNSRTGDLFSTCVYIRFNAINGHTTQFKRCLFSRLAPTHPEGLIEQYFQSITAESCLFIGGHSAIDSNATGGSSYINCTFINQSEHAYWQNTATSATCTHTIVNCVSYGCSGTLEWNFSSMTGFSSCSNNASEDGSHPGADGVTITSNPFKLDGFSPTNTGQLYQAGTTTSVTTDLLDNTFGSPPAIGAAAYTTVFIPINIDDVFWNPTTGWDYAVYDGSTIPGDSIMYYADGTDDTSSANTTTMTDSTASWTVDEWIGFRVINVTDGTSALITDNTATTLTTSGITWDSGDAYQIVLAIDTPDQIVYETTTNLGGTVSMTTVGVPTITGASGTHTFNVKYRDISDSNAVSSTVTVTVTV